MYGKLPNLKRVVAAFLLIGSLSPAARADEAALDSLFEQLKAADPEAAQQIESQIWDEWSRSGSAAMDLLLDRGREAMEAEDNAAAIEHFSALIDHAPDFAEGYNARAMAFYSEGDYGEALADIRRTLELNPRHFGALSGLALILQELGMEDQALEVWRSVADLNPNAEGAQEAIESLEKSVEGVSL
ncbi:tetratricopeptide repeat protein [Palleronia sp. KMU-117]|uniref:tetratricopeptide repeat protein n=1 Tax=Palleronia sp. KMU-117 TaxID=3434108 RepID=UPI003D75814B